jgi:hypothetical protein
MPGQGLHLSAGLARHASARICTPRSPAAPRQRQLLQSTRGARRETRRMRALGRPFVTTLVLRYHYIAVDTVSPEYGRKHGQGRTRLSRHSPAVPRSFTAVGPAGLPRCSGGRGEGSEGEVWEFWRIFSSRFHSPLRPARPTGACKSASEGVPAAPDDSCPYRAFRRPPPPLTNYERTSA